MRKLLVNHGQTNKVKQTCETPPSDHHSAERNFKIRTPQNSGTKLCVIFFPRVFCFWIRCHASDLHGHNHTRIEISKVNVTTNSFNGYLKRDSKDFGPASTIYPVSRFRFECQYCNLRWQNMLLD